MFTFIHEPRGEIQHGAASAPAGENEWTFRYPCVDPASGA